MITIDSIGCCRTRCVQQQWFNCKLVSHWLANIFQIHTWGNLIRSEPTLIWWFSIASLSELFGQKWTELAVRSLRFVVLTFKNTFQGQNQKIDLLPGQTIKLTWFRPYKYLLRSSPNLINRKIKITSKSQVPSFGFCRALLRANFVYKFRNVQYALTKIDIVVIETYKNCKSARENDWHSRIFWLRQKHTSL